jgi:hypothetical protein
MNKQCFIVVFIFDYLYLLLRKNTKGTIEFDLIVV